MIDTTVPLVDLHRHLDGNIAPSTIWDLARKHNVAIPGSTLAEFEKLAQVQEQCTDLMVFLNKLDFGVSVLADYDAVYRVAYENVKDAKAQGLDYTELRFSPFYMAQAYQLNMAEVVNVVADAVRAGSKDFGVKTNLIGILSRTFGVDACYHELEAILTHKDKVCALDLAGDEVSFPAQLFIPHFKKAREQGLNVTVHAGEASGPQSVWDAIELLGATRIGHGVASIQDPKLMDYLVEHDIVIESCLTSNYQTATVNNIESHPIPFFLKHGVKVCLNTDDPAVSNITLKHEYDVAKRYFDFTNQQLKQIQLNGVSAAFLSDSDKKALLVNK